MKKIKKSKFNLLDVVIIVILFSLVIAAYLKTNHREITMMNIKETKATITLNIENNDDTDFSKLAGTELFLSENNQIIGIVDNITQETHTADDSVTKEVGIDSNNHTYSVTVNNAIVKESEERGYYLNGSYFIARGKALSITTQDGITFSAIIDNITPHN